MNTYITDAFLRFLQAVVNAATKLIYCIIIFRVSASRGQISLTFSDPHKLTQLRWELLRTRAVLEVNE